MRFALAPRVLASLGNTARSALTTALLQCSKLLTKKPEPSWQWYDLSRGGARMRNVFMHIGMLRGALEEAQKKGPDVYQQTLALVRAYRATEDAEIFRGFELPAPACRIAAAAEVTREAGEMVTAIVEFAASPTPANEARAVIQTQELVVVAESYTERATRHSWQTPLSA